MDETYAQHLQRMHRDWAAAPATLAAIGRQVSARALERTERIVHGEANEVWRLTFEGGGSAIARIARRSADGFGDEVWALERCLGLGMRVPRVLLVERIDGLEVCVLETLPGERLSDLDLAPEDRRRVCRQIGEDLAKMNTVAELNGSPPSGAGPFETEMGTKAEFEAICARHGAPFAPIWRRIEAAHAAPAPPERLSHNDIRAVHVLVHDGRLSGVIDFGQACLAPPVSDFAKWDYWEGETMPAAWLAEGYGEPSPLADRDLFEAMRLGNGLWVLRWYDLTGYAAGAAQAVARIGRLLASAPP